MEVLNLYRDITGYGKRGKGSRPARRTGTNGWNAPYFHDRGAVTLHEAFSTGTTDNIADDIGAEQLEALIAYLKALPLGQGVPPN